MTLTEQQQTSILQLIQAMFNATPGAVYLNALGSQLTSGKSIADISQSLSGDVLFLGKSYADSMTSEAFSKALVTDLIGNHATEANKTLASDYIVSRLDGGATQAEVIEEITNLLATFPASNADWGAAAVAHNTGNATKLVDNLVGDTVNASEKQGAVDYILAQQASGQTFGQMVDWAINALAEMNSEDAVWGNAARRFDNRMEVSRYYSVEKSGSSTNLSKLQQILAGVTADMASVATAKTAIDKLSSSSSFDLANLDGTNGFRLDGVLGSDQTGFSVSSAGDINGDGFGDVIVGAPQAGDSFFPGAGFVVFGKASGFNETIELAKLNGSDGFRINGAELGGSAGRAVGSAGDINGDGFDDLVISAPFADGEIGPYAGFSYVLFGKSTEFTPTVKLTDLDGSNGFRLNNAIGDSIVGWSVTSAGDVNGDGLDDLIVGAPGTAEGGTKVGVAYVLFGKKSGFAADINLSELNGNNGFRISGLTEGDYLANGVSAGDINGDGLSDVIVTSYGANNPNGANAGFTYVIFGEKSGLGATVDLSTLNGSNGFRIDGEAEGDLAGYSVSTAGDINGDGFDDIVIGAPYSDHGGEDAGASYVVFGKVSGFDATLDLSTLDGTNGFRLEAVSGNDQLGKFAISTAGDFNKDGFDDLIVGSLGADSSGLTANGGAYIVFGKASGFTASIKLAELSAADGLTINGLQSGDGLGQAVSDAGDINNDGFADVIVGVPFGDGNTVNSGTAYIIFGHNLVA